MKLWITLALRNAVRNLRRTVLTGLTVVVGVALVVLALSWVEGIFGGMIVGYTQVSGHIRILDADFAAREALFPLYENIPDAEAVTEALRGVPGVEAVEPRLAMGVVLGVGEEIGEDFALVVGASDRYYRERLKGPERVLAGTWLSGASGEVVLGSRVAERAHVSVGQEILLLGQTQYGSMSPVTAKVVGIVGGDAMLDSQAYLPLQEMQWMVDLAGGALELDVYTSSHDIAVVAPLVEALRTHPALAGMAVQPWYEREPLASTLPILDGMKAFIQGLIVFMTSLAIFNTMTMSVLERTGEIGVMRAMGLSRLGAVGLFMVEALSIGGLGGLVGVLLGAVPSWYLEVNGVVMSEDLMKKVGENMPVSATFYADLSSGIVVQSLVLGLIIAVLGALLPALRAASIQPVAAMHARR